MSDLLFNGVTAYARVEEQKWSAPLLAIRPHRNQFTYVVLPPERIIAATLVTETRPAYWKIELRGEFSRTGDPPVKVVGPMADRDAEGMCRALAERFGLPRVAIPIAPHQIAALPAHSYVVVTGRYHEVHCEMPNFEGIVVTGADFEQTRSYRVTGFTTPGISRHAPLEEPLAVGYNGPRLTAVEVEPI